MTAKSARVGEVLELQRRAVVVEPSSVYGEIGVRSFGRGIFHKEPVSGADLGAKRVFRIHSGDLVISNVFAWEGAIAVASEAEDGKIGSHRFMTFIPTDDRIDTSWAAWFFRSEQGLELIRKASPGSAGRNRTLAIERFEALEIPLPPIDEQRHLAQRLNRLNDSVSGLIQRSGRASRLTDAFIVSVSARPDLDWDVKVRSGWRRIPLSQVAMPNSREVPVMSDGTYNIAGIYSFGRGLFERRILAGTQTSYKSLNQLQAGQLVMSRLKAWEGALAIVPPRLEGWFVSPEFPTFDIDTEQAELPYLEVVLTSERFWNRLKGASHGIGARRERVSAERLLDQVIELPTLEDQRSIAGTIRRLHASQSLRQRAEQRVGSLVPAAINHAFASLN